jgi:sulfide:quinone oxidoreductase
MSMWSGDTTNLPVSKTGSAAHFQAEVVAENIASIVKIGVAGARL